MNTNNTSYRGVTDENKNTEIVFLKRNKVFERGDDLSGTKFHIISLPAKNNDNLEYVRNIWA